MDYPWVTHVVETLRQKNIQIIVAVTENDSRLHEGGQICAEGTVSAALQDKPCPSCPNVCIVHRAGFMCRSFSRGLNPGECETRCVHLSLTLVGPAGGLATEAPSSGPRVEVEGCRVHFLLRPGQKDDSIRAHVAPQRACPSGPDVTLITAVLSSSVVVLLGVARLLLWKLLTSIGDRREFARFQRDAGNRARPVHTHPPLLSVKSDGCVVKRRSLSR
ncbi:unnamed protein product [Pleuronectes platessa]|uniref:Uncharacterized protein n=1 Tax=Pleuronectes platessa TaxID=8262 RepID=A0A9N7V8N4_PLEPL|nr:unnamed protein product [Pleuronectes platessa]